MSRKRLFITGIGGTAGRALVPIAIQTGYDIAGTIHNNFPQELKILSDKDRLKTYQLDLINSEEIAEAIHDYQPDIIFHLAGKVLGGLDKQISNPAIYEQNLTVFNNIVKAVGTLQKPTRLILTSGCLLYDKLTTPDFIQEVPTSTIRNIDKDLQPYRASKLEQERILSKQNFDYIIVRPTQFTGPGKVPGVVEWYIAQEIQQILEGKSKLIKVYNKLGEVDMLDARDVAKALLTVAKKGKKGEIYHISTGVPTTVEDLAKTFMEVVGLDPDNYPIESTGTEQSVYFRFSPNKLKRLGWKPDYSLQECLTSYWEYFKKTIGNYH